MILDESKIKYKVEGVCACAGWVCVSGRGVLFSHSLYTNDNLIGGLEFRLINQNYSIFEDFIFIPHRKTYIDGKIQSGKGITY